MKAMTLSDQRSQKVAIVEMKLFSMLVGNFIDQFSYDNFLL